MKNNFVATEIANLLVNKYNKFKNSNYLKELCYSQSNRVSNYAISDLDFYVDYSKNWIDDEIFTCLLKIADSNHLSDKIDAMFSGKNINITEDRAVLHTALRDIDKISLNVPSDGIHEQIKSTQTKIKNTCELLINNKLLGFSGKPINTIVNIGIGGSDLGPKMTYHALKPYWNKKISCYFVSNIDPFDINTVLELCDPQTTLFIVSSKSFTTSETLANAQSAKEWLLKVCEPKDLNKHFIAVTSSVNKALEFGILDTNIYPMWDWVGGRFSLWSAIGLPIALGTSYHTYFELLKGANDLDKHFKSKSWSDNIPVILALLGIGYINFAGATSHALLPYSQNLEYFPSYIQQLDMESNGKSVDLADNQITYSTGPIIWGATGTNGQHAFHQLLHQGTHIVPCDFIVPVNSYYEPKEQQQALVANALAQSRTLLDGTDASISVNHKKLFGNKPSTTIMFDQLSPYNLGILIAIYEHKVFTQGVIWGINSFDQWGVERGKVIAADLLARLKYNNNQLDDSIINTNLDTSTVGLIEFYQKNAI